MEHIALYDMDKTITRKATWTSFLIHAAVRNAPWRLLLLPAAGVATLAYAAKRVDRAGLKQATQRLLLGRAVPLARMQAVAESFADHVVASGMFEGARARIQADRAVGRRVVLATASYGFYAQAIAARLGIDDVIATQHHVGAQGEVMARIAGENCYGPAKLRMILDWFAAHGIDRAQAHVRFYSDHVSDAPALEWADEPFAVNAHGPLRALAAQRGWPILDWEG